MSEEDKNSVKIDVEDEIEEEVGCKTYIFIRKMTKLLELYTPTFN